MPGPLLAYPGYGPLTIHDSGTGSPGVVVNEGSYGRVTVPLTMTGNNDVTAGNIVAADQAEQDTGNWSLWRIQDWITGGDYRSLFRAQVSLGGSLVLDRSWAGDTTSALIVEGPGGAAAWAMDVFGGGAVTTGTGRAARFTGADAATSAVDIYGGAVGATCDALSLYGGATGGRALYAQAMAGNSAAVVALGHGNKAGLEATAGGTAGTPAILAHAGPVKIDTNIADATADTGANCQWGEQIVKARGRINLADTTAAVTVSTGGIAIDTVTKTDPSGSGSPTKINVKLARAMANAEYDVIPATYNIPTGTNAGRYVCTVDIIDAQNFKLWFMTGPTSVPQDLAGNGAASVSFVVLGKQT